MLPDNMPRQDFAEPAMYTISFIGRVFKYIFLIGVGTASAAFIAFEGMHVYVEKVCLPAPPPKDEWGWNEEVQSWTGGSQGGTDPRLGRKARHALRGAWVAQEWGAGLTGGTIGRKSGGEAVEANKVDVGYEMADRYLELAISEAKKRGMVFPPTLSVLRSPGPSEQKGLQGDPAAVDLMLLQAGVLERLSSPETLGSAKEIYETVWAVSDGDAKTMRLAGKVGDLSARLGLDNEAMAWWEWGLARAGVQSGVTTTPTLSPPILRAAINLLSSASAHLAITSQLNSASTLQETALSLLPPSHPLPSPTTLTAPAVLQDTWLQHRAALFTLHHSSILHALDRPALHLAIAASERAEHVISAISPLPHEYDGYEQAKALHRDALLLGAEAAYTRGALLARAGATQQIVADCYQRAMGLSAQESGQTEEGKMSEDGKRYWRAYARVRGKIDEASEKGRIDTQGS